MNQRDSTIGNHPANPVFMRVGGVLQVRLNSVVAAHMKREPMEILPRGAPGQLAPVAEARSDADVALADAYMMLAQVIARAEIYSVDRDARALYDETKASGSMDRVIAERVRAGRFIAWLEQNQALAVVQAIPLGKGMV